jgi:hypothetical protein
MRLLTSGGSGLKPGKMASEKTWMIEVPSSTKP